jgi:hypothetical protein
VNNPLNYVDPSGFLGEPDQPPILPIRVVEQTNDDGSMDVLLIYPPRVRPAREGPPQLIAVVPSNDMDTTGSDVPQPQTGPPETPQSWKEDPFVQIESGFLAGLALGIVPFGGAAHQVLDETKVIWHGTPLMNRGLAVGQIVGGIFTMVGGVTGEVLGGAVSATGIGAAIGVPAMVVSTTLVVGGAANVAAGFRGLVQSMMSSGSGSGGTSTDRAPPNPYGKLGGPEHRAKVAEIVDDVEARHLTPVKEHRIATPGGSKPVRYVDVAATDASRNIVELHQVGRQTQYGQPVARELQAIDDIEKAMGIRPIFHPYNGP